MAGEMIPVKNKLEKEAKVREPEDLWRHRYIFMRCRTCMFFVGKEGDLGRCRKHAPTLNGWPAVFNMDWCGDHKLDGKKT